MTDTYKMTVDLNVLDHLGINLYSNIAAVLTEAVANAWDADAENVEIKLQKWAVQNVLPKGTLKGVGAAGEKK